MKLALKMALYRYITGERLTYPTKVPSLSDKQVVKMNAEVKRAQEEDTSGHGKYNEYTPEEHRLERTWTRKGSQTILKAFVQESSAFYTQLSLHISTLTPQSNVPTGRSVWVTYTSRDNYV